MAVMRHIGNKELVFFQKADRGFLHIRPLSISKMNAQSWNALGERQLEKGNNGKAAARFSKALDIFPNYSEARLNLSVAQYRLGLNGEAHENALAVAHSYASALSGGVQTAPSGVKDELSTAYLIIGYTSAIFNRHGEAIEAFSTSIAAKSLNPEAQGGLALSYLRMGNDDLSQYCRTQETLQYSARGHKKLKSKDYLGAAEDFSLSLRNSASASALLGRADALSAMGKYKPAISDYASVVKGECGIRTSADLEKAHFGRGTAYFNDNRDFAAFSDFSKVLEINPHNAEARANLKGLENFKQSVQPVAYPA